MSRLSLLCIDIFWILIASGISNEFTCINNQCSCLDGECTHTCSSSECINTYFICLSSASLCLVNCNGFESCKHATLIGAAANTVLNCNGTDACSSTHVFCGRQDLDSNFPDDLPSFFTANQFIGSMAECFINLLTPNAMRSASISCVGSIADCIIDAYAEQSISQSLFECNTDTSDASRCELNCIKATSCDSMQYICNSPLCSCGADHNCANPAINRRQNTLHAYDVSTEQYNCVHLRTTDIEMRSMFKPERESTFHYEITGKDEHHHTILFRYQSIEDNSLSASLHDIHQSVYFTEHEKYGKTYDFEWVFNEPNIVCWRTDELSAIKIDLFYNQNISFAFTYIYSEEMRRKASGSWLLTAKNNWNLGVTYLENGFLYFDYEFNVSFAASASSTTTTTTTIVQISPEQTTTNDSPNNQETTEAEAEAEAQVVESTTSNDASNSMDSRANKALSTNNTDTPIKGLLFGIAMTALCSILCVIACIAYNKKKQTQRLAAVYASSADEDMHMMRGNQGDIEQSEEENDNNNNNAVSDATSNDIEDMRMASGILDENDFMDVADYNRMANNNAGDATTRESQSIASVIKKYKKLDPRNILPSGFDREVSETKSISESGVGYITKSAIIANGSDDDQGLTDDESLLARDADISMDAEYHHIVTQDIDASLVNEDEEVMKRLQMNAANDHIRTQSNSITEQSENILMDKVLLSTVHKSQTSLGFEAESILEHYVNQDSTFQTLKNNINMDKERKEEEVSVSESMSRLSQSLMIPPIQLDHNIADIKTIKSRTTVQSAAESMKKFSDKIASCAAKFGHDDDDNELDADDIEDVEADQNQFATMVIYKNESKSSNIPESQIVQSRTPPNIPLLNGVNAFLDAESTQTMIVKHDRCESQSFNTQLSQIQSSHDMLVSDESSSDEVSNSPKDPISDDDEVSEPKKRHAKNLSTVSNKSRHDRRTMIINDDLDVQHLIDIDDSDSD